MAGTRRVATPIRANISITPARDGQVAEAHPLDGEAEDIHQGQGKEEGAQGGDILGGIADQGLPRRD